MELTSPLLYHLLVAGALLVPLVVVGLWRRGAGQTRIWARIAHLVLRWVALLLCQLLAVGAIALGVNNQWNFYDSWDDLRNDLGGAPAQVDSKIIQTRAAGANPPIIRMPVTAHNPHPRGQLVTLTVPGTAATAPYSTVQVWLPPQYFEKAQEKTRFPVLVMMGGGRHETGAMFQAQSGGAATNLAAIAAGQATPFIAVYTGVTVVDGIDSECTDLPNGTQGRSWYVRDLVPAIQKHFRTASTPSRWFAGGWSTGGWCAAALVAKYPRIFRAGFGLAPYFKPVFDSATLAQDQQLISDNSVLRMVQENRLKEFRFYSVFSLKDAQSYGDGGRTQENGQVLGDGEDFIKAARDLPGTAFQLLPLGGHRPDTYYPHIPEAIAWLGIEGL